MLTTTDIGRENMIERFQNILTGLNMKYCAWLLMASTAAAAEFHGLRPTAPGGRSGLRNPELGLRTEAYIALPEGGHVFLSCENRGTDYVFYRQRDRQYIVMSVDR